MTVPRYQIAVWVLILAPLLLFPACFNNPSSTEDSLQDFSTIGDQGDVPGEPDKTMSDDLLSNELNTVTSSLDAFSAARTEQDRYASAAEVLEAMETLRAASGTRFRLSPTEADVEARAEAYAISIRSAARAFESGLEPADIKFVTQDNPGSWERAAGIFFLATGPSSCPEKEFTALRARLGAKELSQVGPMLMEINSFDQLSHRHSYITRIGELVRTRPAFGKYSFLVTTYYSYYDRPSPETGPTAAPRPSVEKAQERAMRLAALAPHCIGAFSPEFLKRLHENGLVIGSTRAPRLRSW